MNSPFFVLTCTTQTQTRNEYSKPYCFTVCCFVWIAYAILLRNTFWVSAVFVIFIVFLLYLVERFSILNQYTVNIETIWVQIQTKTNTKITCIERMNFWMENNGQIHSFGTSIYHSSFTESKENHFILASCGCLFLFFFWLTLILPWSNKA